MTFERLLQWRFRMSKLRMKFTIISIFYPCKAIFLHRRFTRLEKKMLRYAALECERNIKELQKDEHKLLH